MIGYLNIIFSYYLLSYNKSVRCEILIKYGICRVVTLLAYRYDLRYLIGKNAISVKLVEDKARECVSRVVWQVVAFYRNQMSSAAISITQKLHLHASINYCYYSYLIYFLKTLRKLTKQISAVGPFCIKTKPDVTYIVFFLGYKVKYK